MDAQALPSGAATSFNQKQRCAFSLEQAFLSLAVSHSSERSRENNLYLQHLMTAGAPAYHQ
jgi:hypothetical protein